LFDFFFVLNFLAIFNFQHIQVILMVPHPFSSFLLFLFNKHQGSQSFASLPLEIVFQIFDSSSRKFLIFFKLIVS